MGRGAKMMKRLMAGLLCTLLLLGVFTATAAALDLKYGSEGKQVRLAQARLKQLGYYSAVIDGKFGYLTFKAVRGFQSNNGLKLDGIIGQQTVTALYGDDVATSKGILIVSALAIRAAYGDSGPAIDLIQKKLKELHYYSGILDGRFGYATYRAVRSFQSVNSLKVDGVIGRLTWNKLFSASALPKPAV
jgi:peptidoglycan hydrolase-like protein with peptidoglycan-binding domain